VTSHPTSPPTGRPARPGRLLSLAALTCLTLSACVPAVSTPTPPAGKPPPVPDKILQAPNVPSPPPGAIPGATPVGAYPVPGPSPTPESRPAPSSKGYP
jgi:hypothetical protein